MSPLGASMWSSLRVRNYRLFASGQVVSLTGTWMQRVAQDWLVVNTLTHTSGTAVGITTGLQFLPMLLFGLYGGVIADRYNKRRTLLWTQAAQALCAVALAVLVLAGAVQLWHVYLLAFLLGVVTAVDNPTRQAFVMELVGPDLVTNAVSLNSATFNTARIVGPSVAGLMITAFSGTGPVFVVNALSYLAVIAGLFAMRDSELYDARRVARARGQLREGIAYVRARPELWLPIVLVGVIGMFGYNFQITIALMVKGVFHRDAAAFGLLSTALAAGSLVGALLAARRGRPTARLLIGGSLAFGVLELVCGLTPGYWAFFLMLVPTGIVSITFNTSANMTMQLGSAPDMRGRVMALYMLVFMGGTPIGAPLIGWLAEQLGARYSLIIGGGVSAVAAAAVGAGLLHYRRLLAPPPPAVAPEPLYDEVRSAT